MGNISYSDLWNRICKTLDEQLPGWRKRIKHAGQITAVEKREKGYLCSDREIFEGIVKAVVYQLKQTNNGFSKNQKVILEVDGNMVHVSSGV